MKSDVTKFTNEIIKSFEMFGNILVHKYSQNFKQWEILNLI